MDADDDARVACWFTLPRWPDPDPEPDPADLWRDDGEPIARGGRRDRPMTDPTCSYCRRPLSEHGRSAVGPLWHKCPGPAAQTYDRIVHLDVHFEHKVGDRADGLAAENASLRAENARLRAEVDRLRAETGCPVA